MQFFVNVFFSKCYQIHSFLRIWSHLLNKFLMKNFIFCAVPAEIYKKIRHQNIDIDVALSYLLLTLKLHSLKTLCFVHVEYKSVC